MKKKKKQIMTTHLNTKIIKKTAENSLFEYRQLNFYEHVDENSFYDWITIIYFARLTKKQSSPQKINVF